MKENLKSTKKNKKKNLSKIYFMLREECCSFLVDVPNEYQHFIHCILHTHLKIKKNWACIGTKSVETSVPDFGHVSLT